MFSSVVLWSWYLKGKSSSCYLVRFQPLTEFAICFLQKDISFFIGNFGTSGPNFSHLYKWHSDSHFECTLSRKSFLGPLWNSICHLLGSQSRWCRPLTLSSSSSQNLPSFPWRKQVSTLRQVLFLPICPTHSMWHNFYNTSFLLAPGTQGVIYPGKTTVVLSSVGSCCFLLSIQRGVACAPPSLDKNHILGFLGLGKFCQKATFFAYFPWGLPAVFKLSE